MPMPMAQGRADAPGGPDKAGKLSAEVSRLRREVNALKGQISGDGARGSLTGWLTMALAACGTLLGLIALLKNH